MHGMQRDLEDTSKGTSGFSKPSWVYVCQIFFFSTKFKITLPPQNARKLLEKKR